MTRIQIVENTYEIDIMVCTVVSFNHFIRSDLTGRFSSDDGTVANLSYDIGNDGTYYPMDRLDLTFETALGFDGSECDGEYTLKSLEIGITDADSNSIDINQNDIGVSLVDNIFRINTDNAYLAQNVYSFTVTAKLDDLAETTKTIDFTITYELPQTWNDE